MSDGDQVRGARTKHTRGRLVRISQTGSGRGVAVMLRVRRHSSLMVKATVTCQLPV